METQILKTLKMGNKTKSTEAEWNAKGGKSLLKFKSQASVLLRGSDLPRCQVPWLSSWRDMVQGNPPSKQK